MIEIVKYNPALKLEWDRFVNNTKNGTFIHLRDYMDYHSNRFSDFSLLALANGGSIVAVLPANVVGDTVYSHQGLSFGGWLYKVKHFDVLSMLEVFDKAVDFLRCNGISRLVYKPSPHIYHRYPAEEDLYALFRHGASLDYSLISSTVPMDNRLRFNENSRRAIAKIDTGNVIVEESADFDGFWSVLTSLLHSRYATSPVHSLDEIKLLHSRFPQRIRLFTASSKGEILGGTVIYCYDGVAHTQYIAASPRGKEINVLPYLFGVLMDRVFADCRYFDFGTSNEHNGACLNSGLIIQKAGMGGRGIVHNCYSLKF